MPRTSRASQLVESVPASDMQHMLMARIRWHQHCALDETASQPDGVVGTPDSTRKVSRSQATIFKGRCIGRMLASGAFGEVYRAVNMVNREAEVVKVVQNDLQGKKEMAIMKRLPEHPNIVKHFYSTTTPRNIYMFMECGGRITLFRYQASVRWSDGAKPRRGCFDRDTALDIFEEIADAVLHLHYHNVCHLDIEPHNVVVNDEGTTRLVDFSCAGSARRRHAKLVGTLPYIAPEVLHPPADGYDGCLADCFSMGVLLFDMINGVDAMFKALSWHQQSSDELMQDPKRRAAELKMFLSAMIAEPPSCSDDQDLNFVKGMYSMLCEQMILRPELQVACDLLSLVPAEGSRADVIPLANQDEDSVSDFGQ